jgi:hypothetical protein
MNSAEWKDMTRKLECAKIFIPKEVIGRELPSYVLQNSVMVDHFSLSGKMMVLARLMKAIGTSGHCITTLSLSFRSHFLYMILLMLAAQN